MTGLRWSCLQYTSSAPLLFFLPLLLLSSLALVLYVIYQSYLHPLAKYPGPVLARLTQAHDVYHAYIGTKHIDFYNLHAKYGPVVRYSPNSLSINDPAALKAISAHNANVQKAEFYRCFRAAPNAASTLLATDKVQHARKRRVMGQAFSDQAVKGFEQYVVGHVVDLVEQINGAIAESSRAAPTKTQTSDEKRSGLSWSAPVDMATWANYLIFDIMGDLVFGRSFGTLGERPENRRGIYLLGRAARRNYVMAAMPFLIKSGLEKVLPIFRGLYRDRGEYLAFGRRQVNERLKEGGSVLDVKTAGSATGEESLPGRVRRPTMESGRRDIFSFLLHARDPETGQGFPMSELWMEGNTLIVAGSDTTSTTLAAMLHYLAHDQQTLERLQKEMRHTFGHRAEIQSGPKMQSCTYLRACIDETLRMSPAVGGLLPREVLAGGLAIPSLDMHIPAGVDVGVPIYAIQHHSDYIEDPFVFNPDRWLSGDDDDDASSPLQHREELKEVFCPFGVGNRACLGKPLVYLEISVAVARLLWEFDMRLSPVRPSAAVDIARDVRNGKRSAKEYHLKDWFMSANEGPWVEFRRREESC